MTQADYDETTRKLGVDQPNSVPAEGIISHYAGPIEGGGWFIFGVWETREAFERFYESRLRHVIAGTPMADVKPRWVHIHREAHAAGSPTAMRRAA